MMQPLFVAITTLQDQGLLLQTISCQGVNGLSLAVYSHGCERGRFQNLKISRVLYQAVY